ncbi:hypothetical protein [Streptomyces sp. NPDC059459]|uniref:hypothetical protein n=1 Tax=unclassified Streptomyces TaxID=2593676 RepID=UPI0036B2652B
MPTPAAAHRLGLLDRRTPPRPATEVLREPPGLLVGVTQGKPRPAMRQRLD